MCWFILSSPDVQNVSCFILFTNVLKIQLHMSSQLKWALLGNEAAFLCSRHRFLADFFTTDSTFHILARCWADCCWTCTTPLSISVSEPSESRGPTKSWSLLKRTIGASKHDKNGRQAAKLSDLYELAIATLVHFNIFHRGIRIL